MKQCSICEILKDTSLFVKDKSVKSGIGSYCRDCCNAKNRERRKQNLVKYHTKELEYRDKNKCKIRETCRDWKHENIALDVPCSNCSKLKNFSYDYYTKEKSLGNLFFCSFLCRNLYNGKTFKKKCECCDREIHVQKTKLRNNNFCSRNCQGRFSARNKKHGIKRSKLELLLESYIKIKFPTLKVIYSDLSAIGSELDIYIPSLKLAFEINGIFHYKPIFGEDKLKKIQENDLYKKNLCLENGIEIIYVDSSNLKHTNKKTASVYINYVLNEIYLRYN